MSWLIPLDLSTGGFAVTCARENPREYQVEEEETPEEQYVRGAFLLL